MESDPDQANRSMQEPTDEERARLSGPAMRAFANIAHRWGLPEHRQLQLLGCKQWEFHNWVLVARSHEPLILKTDIMMRISAILGILADLRQFLKTAGDERRWLLRPIAAPPFAGHAPIDLLALSHQHQIEVRLYLAGLMHGRTPEEAEISLETYASHTVVWH